MDQADDYRSLRKQNSQTPIDQADGLQKAVQNTSVLKKDQPTVNSDKLIRKERYDNKDHDNIFHAFKLFCHEICQRIGNDQADDGYSQTVEDRSGGKL